MSFFSKLMDTMRVHDDSDDDEYYDDDDQDYDERPVRSSSRRNSDDFEEEHTEVAKPRFFSRPQKVAPVRKSMEVSLVKPTSVEDGREICDYLLDGKAVVLNMEGIHTEIAQRIIDFTSGATYSMNGKLQKISNYIFIVTPASVELSGDFQELLNSGSMNISGMPSMSGISGINLHL